MILFSTIPISILISLAGLKDITSYLSVYFLTQVNALDKGIGGLETGNHPEKLEDRQA